MKPASIDLREKIVAAHLERHHSIRTVARMFAISKSVVQKLVKQQKIEGNLQPKKPGKPRLSYLTNAEVELRELVTEHPDATLVELCEFFADKTGNWVGRSAMGDALRKLGLSRKKKRKGVPKLPLRES
ncbi:IS630 transposase-related protein [Chamaesiphon sp.]|uniref:IS630 transposase-related protein n=1 Tax=Chamaesiphon sp. TaxID=2814140 RepID=UPI0035938791